MTLLRSSILICLIASFPMAAEESAEVAPLPENGAVVQPADEQPAENPPDAHAETIPLPPEKPVLPTGAAPSEKLEPALVVETPAIQLGQPVTFSLYGPETFLRRATAQYVLRDEFGRHLARGALQVQNLPFSEGRPRQISLSRINVLFPAPGAGAPRLSQRLFFEMSLVGSDQQRSQLNSSFLVSRAPPSTQGTGSNSAASGTQTWERWMTWISSPPGTGSNSAASGTWEKLRAIGVTGGMQYRLNPARREVLRKGEVPFYVENVARQLLSRYQTESGLWQAAISKMQAGRENPAALAREPSLCSLEFAEAFSKEIIRHADLYAKDPPVFYSLASEPSVTRLGAAADFDFSPPAIAEFQRWLERDAYGTLRALNESWDTQYATWQDVVPMTTDAALKRLKDGPPKLGPWVDFRAFQDYTFNKVLADGANLLKQHHPGAKVGITGAMGPFAFGGWDWSRLAETLDVVECYDIGGVRALWRSLAPGKPAFALAPLHTGSNIAASGTEAAGLIWSMALEGGPRGVLLWDEPPARGTGSDIAASAGGEPNSALLDANGEPTKLARELSPLLQLLQGDVGELLARATRANESVAILYSPASVRLHWLLEAGRLHGDKWLEAWGLDTASERRESPQLRLRESWCKLLDDLGLGWRFISSAQLENELVLNLQAGIKTIVLPQALALSEREAEVLKQFAAGGGRVVADAACGRFDEHGRLRKRPALDELLGVDTSTEPFISQPMNPLESVKPLEVTPQLAEILGAKGVLAVFSDAPKFLPGKGSPRSAADYRRSPVLAYGRGGVYVNLDLTDYLRWRLHPDQPRAAAVRAALAMAAFPERLAESPVDWENSQLPPGTQVICLRVPQAPQSILLALRRNPQARLHELGTEEDSNWAFEKPELFSLSFRKPVGVHTIYLPGVTERSLDQKESAVAIKGRLDPVMPNIFMLHSGPLPGLTLTAPQAVLQAEMLEVKISSGAKESASLFSVHVMGPDLSERVHYGGAQFSPDGTATHRIPFALNDPPGAWKIVVRDLINGSETTTTVMLKAAD